MAEAERLSETLTVGRVAKLRGQLWNFEDNLLAKGIIIQYTSKPEKGFIYFITLRLISTTRIIAGK